MSRRERRLLRRKGTKLTHETNEHYAKSHEANEAEHHQKEAKPKYGKFFTWYEKNFKKHMWITIILLVISIMVIIGTRITTGDYVYRGISLKGGVTATVPYDQPINIAELQSTLQDKLGSGINVRALSRAGTTIGIIVDASDVDSDLLVDALEAELGKLPKLSVETMGSALGESFFEQTILALFIAFVLMAIVVFLAFKTFIPGFAVILSAFSDITMTIATLDIFRVRIETAGIAALLMLVGYSVDTDILLTTRVLKRKIGTAFDRVVWAMRTGMTMTITSFAAIFVGYFFTQSEILRQIMLILLIGLFFDIFNTWIQNVGILRWYVEKKQKKEAKETLEKYHAGAAHKEEHKTVHHNKEHEHKEEHKTAQQPKEHEHKEE